MKFPRNEIGISDMLQWRDCPERMDFGMRRHERGDPPESWSPQNAYGSAIHLAIHLLDQGSTDEEAVQAAYDEFANWLDPSDVTLLYEDLAKYVERDQLGVRTVVSEEDRRVPLMEWEGEQVYFRFKLDRLYQRLDNDGAFIHIDYKSSKWIKSEAEVDEDIQLWAYNFGIHEAFPEVESLIQVYDQLRAGQLSTGKGEEQREEMRRWLVHTATSMLKDETMDPRYNEWCPYCPLKMDCPVVRYELTDYAQAKIAALAPRVPKLKQDGTPGKTLLPPELDPARLGEYVAELPTVKHSIKTLEAFRDEVEKTLRRLPEQARRDAGYALDERSRRQLPTDALRLAHHMVGDEFYHLVSLTEASLERFYGKSDERVAEIMDLSEKSPAYTVLRKVS